MVTHTHTYSGRADHGGTTLPPASYERLIEWARKWNVDRIAMGSPYTPDAAAMYGRFDGADASSYYGGEIDQQAVRDAELASARAMVKQINALSGETPRFFLDNETPKARYGHLWWVGHEPQFASWHDYDQPFDRWMCHHADAADGRDEPMPYQRRPYMQIVAEQRALGAVGVWAHPTSWWTGADGRFITNIASEMPIHAFAEGFIDGVVVMGYHPRRPEYEAIWQALLDRGIRAAGYAEMDIGLSEENLHGRTHPLCNVIAHAERSLSWDRQMAALREGHFFCSSGPLVSIEVDGIGMGQLVRADAHQRHHTVSLVVEGRTPQEPLARVELVGREGRVLWAREDCPPGAYDIPMDVASDFGYVYARCAGREQGSYNGKPGRLLEYAVSNPVYLQAGHVTPRKPAQTRVVLRISDDSPWVGGQLQVETALGESLADHVIRAGRLTMTLPASSRLSFVSADGQQRLTEYLINANPRLIDLQRYLYRGRWRRDFPLAVSGQVPVEAWRLDEMEQALVELKLER